MIMYRKAGLYLPFYRQEMDFGMSGVPIPRETQARRFIKVEAMGSIQRHCININRAGQASI